MCFLPERNLVIGPFALGIMVLLFVVFWWPYLLKGVYFLLFQARPQLCVFPGTRQLCLRKNVLYGFVNLVSIPFKTLRGISRSLGVSHLCSITNMSSSLQVELVSGCFFIRYYCMPCIIILNWPCSFRITLSIEIFC